MVAHEVKNPLAGIKGAMQVFMSRRPVGDAELPIMGDIVNRIDALNELIQGLLVFARPRPPKLQPVELRPLLSDAIAMMRKDPVGEGVQTTIEGPDIGLEADSVLLRATFTNLLLNAAQAMHGTGAIRIRIDGNATHARIEVRDNGPGIPVEIRDKIFEPFFATKARGGGLGLAIARRSIELHGRRLTPPVRPRAERQSTSRYRFIRLHAPKLSPSPNSRPSTEDPRSEDFTVWAGFPACQECRCGIDRSK